MSNTSDEQAGEWLIIGIGNRLRRDDGIGPILAERLAARGLCTIEHSGECSALIHLWQDWTRVLLLDATRSNSTAGCIRMLDAHQAPLERNLFHHSCHQLGAAEAIEMAHALDRLPETLWILGIEGEEFGFGEGLSPAVASAIPQAVDSVLQLIGIPVQLSTESPVHAAP